MDDKILVIVDMINGFVKVGDISDPKMIKIVDENVRITKMFLDNKYKIIAFKDSHSVESVEFKIFPKHCIRESVESELIDELKVYENKFNIFEKNSTNGLFAPGFLDYISSLESLREIVIIGVCTDICVMNFSISIKTFFDQINKDVNIIVVENAVDTYDIPNIHNKEEWNAMAFKFMKQAGVQVVKEYSNHMLKSKKKK